MQNLFDTVTAWLDARIDARIAASMADVVSVQPELELTDAQVETITGNVLRAIERDGALDDTLGDVVKEIVENRLTVNIDFY